MTGTQDPEGAQTPSEKGKRQDQDRADREKDGFPEPKTKNPEGIPKGE